jgi:two-component system chemotaxis sensor kinase CheA
VTTGFDEVREHLLGIFLEEAVEHQATLERGALELEAGRSHPELVGAIFRAAHSIKGAAAALGLSEIAAFTHVLEDLLDALREERLAVTRSLGATLLAAVDALGRLIEAARTNATAPDVSAAIAALEAVRPSNSPSSSPASPPSAPLSVGTRAFRVSFSPDPDTYRRGLDPVLLLRDVAALCSRYECATSSEELPRAETLDPEHSYLGFSLDVETSHGRAELEEIFEFAGGTLLIEERTEAARARAEVRGHDEDPSPGLTVPTSPPPDAKPNARWGEGAAPALGPQHAGSVRVDIRKIDRLMDVVGEIVIGQSMLKDLVTHFSLEKLAALQAAVQDMERNTRELQERMMGVRMLPMSTLFQRFPRLVRELGEKLGKRVQLNVEGADTELDKGLIELLADPLTHLVRNAVDHGIETPEARRAAGKDEIGTVTLRAEHEAGAIVLTVADDGRGIDVERVIAKARKNGLVGPNDVIDESHAFDLIFQPGFSTAETVTDVSGRGVGMDVVKKNVTSLSGTIHITHEPGRGAAFIVRLPLTLAIIDGLSVAVGRQTFVLPLLAMRQSFRARSEQLAALPDGRELVIVHKKALPLLRLSTLLGVPGGVERPEQGLTIVVQEAGQVYALLVDGMRGRIQVVMKNLEANYGAIEGILGATILGDGRVALVLDVAGLVKSQQREALRVPRNDDLESHGSPGEGPSAQGISSLQEERSSLRL